MDINAQIVDQRLQGVIEANPDWFLQREEQRKKSEAFVLICISTFLGVTQEEARDLLTDGSNDAGVDGLHFGEVDDGEFTVTLFQAKYKQRLDGQAAFEENAVQKAVSTVSTLFDPGKDIELNPKIKN